jgi:hypothetical protein
MVPPEAAYQACRRCFPYGLIVTALVPSGAPLSFRTLPIVGIDKQCLPRPGSMTNLLLLSSELSHNATVLDVYRNNPELMYIFVAGTPLLRTNSRPSTVRTDNTPKVRFSAKLSQEPEA